MHSKYMIDVAAEREYLNQDEKYRDEFTRWRNDRRNKFGYRFVHDSREHTYVDGGGFADRQAVTAETTALQNCFRLLGLLMLCYFMTEQIFFSLMRLTFDRVHINWVYYSLRGINAIVSSEQVYVFCLMRVVSISVPLLIMRCKVKLPQTVALPRSKLDRELVVYGFSVSAMLIVIFRFLDYALSHFLRLIKIDVTYYTFIQTDTEKAQIIYFLCELMICPILSEILFRGCLLQMFRQFGDNFAIFISSLACAMCYHDISKIVYAFSVGIVLGVLTIRNGNIFVPIVTQLTMNDAMLLLNTIASDTRVIRNRLIEIIVCLILIVVSFTVMIFMRIHFTNPFRLCMDKTELTFQQKLRQLLNSIPAVLWLVCMLLATILSVGFI